MGATFVQDGKAIDYTPATAVAAGQIVDLGHLIGVAKMPIEASALGALAIEGVFTLNKSGSSGPVFAIGDQVFWDLVNQVATRAGGSGCVLFGTALTAAGASDTSVTVLLRPHLLPADMVDRLWEDVDLSGGSKTLDKEDCGKVMNVTVGHATNVVTLPATAAGVAYTIRCGTTGQRVAVSPAAADKFLGPDLTGTDNKDRILASATSRAGDYLSIVADVVDGYFIRAQRGVWTQEP